MGTFERAIAIPPRTEQMLPSVSWLKSISQAGYTHVCLHNHLFFEQENDLSVWGESIFQLLSLYQMTRGPRAEGYQEWLREVARRSAEHGLGLAIQLWEPRLPTHAIHILPADWMGPAIGDAVPLCLSNYDARAWFMESFRVLLGTLPNLALISMGLIDNHAVLCDERCPRCASQPVAVRWGLLFADLQAAIDQHAPFARIAGYDWYWSQTQYDSIFSQLPDDSPVITRLESGSTFTQIINGCEWNCRVGDMAMSCDQVGPDFQRAKQRERVLAMIPLSGMFESFHLPYVPCVTQAARKFDRLRRENASGWIDYDCGGIQQGLMLDLVRSVQANPEASPREWVVQTALGRLGGSEAYALQYVSIWERFDRAVAQLPYYLNTDDIYDFPSRFGISMGLLPLHPFLPERLVGKDQHNRYYWFDPHNMAVLPVAIVIREGMRTALHTVSDFESAYEQLLNQAPAASKYELKREAAIARMVVLQWRSVYHFFSWAVWELTGGTNTQEIEPILEEEIRLTLMFQSLALRLGLGYGNTTFAIERALAYSVRQPADEGNSNDWYARKIASVAEILRKLREP